MKKESKNIILESKVSLLLLKNMSVKHKKHKLLNSIIKKLCNIEGLDIREELYSFTLDVEK